MTGDRSDSRCRPAAGRRLRRLTTTLLAGVLGVAAAQVSPPAAQADASSGLAKVVIPADFPDPDVSKFGDTYYAYGTNNGVNVPVVTAQSPTGPWSGVQEAMPTLGDWAIPGRTWAPDVSKLAEGKYLLYYTARSMTPEGQCIGAAIAKSPVGPFEAVGSGPLVCYPGEGGAIDASSFVDADGRRYLLYKNDGNSIQQPTAIWLQEVNKEDGTTFIGRRTALVRSGTGDAGVVEAPVLVRRDSQYVLFFSTGVFANDGYATRYAVSSVLRGPYQRADQPLMTTESLQGAVRGPGGQDIVAGPDGDHIMFHGWVDNGARRATYAAELRWADGHPVVRGKRVRYETEAGVLSRCSTRPVAGASNGHAVAYIDYADSWVDVTVNAPAAGEYLLYVGYAAGYGDAEQTLTVNDDPPAVVRYPARAWGDWGQVATTINLRQGRNTVRLQHRSRWAELDYIEVV